MEISELEDTVDALWFKRIRFGYRKLFHFDKGGSERADKGCDECAAPRRAAPGEFALKGNFIHL